jgi:type I restriction enzyme S subunit
MEVSPGYKRTDVGVIPKDWHEMLLDHVAKRGSGHTPDKKHPEYWNGNIKWISLADSSALDQVFIDDTISYITPKGLAHSSAVLHPPGTVVLSRDAGIGKSAIMRTEMAVSQHFMAWRCGPYLDNKFLYYWLQAAKPQFERIANGTTIKTIGLQYFKDLKLPVPPHREQCVIATALGDVDGLLDGLDRLIAKKRDLKQAAMQRLLTGQTRLPGFHGEWKLRRLADHVVFLRNGVNSRAELLLEGRVRYIHYGDVHACKDVFMSPASLPYLPDAKAALLERLRDGDLIFADASEDVAGVSKSVELRGVGRTEVVSGMHTIAVRFDKSVLADGFKGYLQFCLPFAGHLRRLAAGTKVYATNRAHIASVEMRLPTVVEQTAIAAVLGDMDAELSALEGRRDKTRALKQGMMQELLTGKTRLVSAGDARG